MAAAREFGKIRLAIMIERQSVAETARQLGIDVDAAQHSLDSGKEKLFALRERRPPPCRDEKVMTAWNGLMISGFSRVGAALNDARYVSAAAKAAIFIRNHLYDAKTGTCADSEMRGPPRFRPSRKTMHF